MDLFGLGILLEFRDLASSRMSNVMRIFRQMQGSAEELDQALDNTIATLNGMAVASGAMISAGKSVMGIGGGLINAFKGVASQVISTNDYFEKSRVTLEALYKDADKAGEVMNKAMSLASTTPFEVQDVTDAIIGFKAIGVEALDTYTSLSGETQTLLQYVGDLAALRPDVGMQGILMGVRNLLGGDNGRSLQMRLDMDLLQFTGDSEWGSSSEEVVQQLVNASSKVANGLMQKLEGTWDQIVSNLEDQKTRFLKAIGDNGAFDSAKKSLSRISDVIQAIDDDEMTSIAQGFAQAFSVAWKPVDLLASGIAKLVVVVKELAKNHPWVLKIVVGLSMLVAVVTTLAGLFIVLKGVFLLVKASALLFSAQIMKLSTTLGLSSTMARATGVSFGFLLGKLILLTAGIGLAVLAWKNDFLGIRSLVENVVKGVSQSISTFKKLMNFDSPEGLINSINYLEKYGTVYDKLAIKAFKVYETIRLLGEAWSDYTLSEDSFIIASELGILPLITNILQLKRTAESFFEGFKTGVEEFSQVAIDCFTAVTDVVGGFIKGLTGQDPFETTTQSLNDFNEKTKAVDVEKWKEIGSVFGTIFGALLLFQGLSTVVKIIGSVGSVLLTVAKFGVGLVKGLATAFSVVGGFISGLGGAITAVLGFFGVVVTLPAWLVGIIAIACVALVALIVKYWNEISSFIMTGLSFLGELFTGFCSVVSTIFLGIFAVISGIIDIIVGVIVGGFTLVVGVVSSLLNGALGIVTSIVTAIVGVFGGMIEFLTGVFTGNWTQAWEGVVSIFSSVFGGIADIGKTVMNAVIGIINGAIRGLNSISVTVPDWSPVFAGEQFGFSIPELPQLSTGGYIKSEGIANLHPNEVVVNSPLTDMLRTFLTNNHDKDLGVGLTPKVKDTDHRLDEGLTAKVEDFNPINSMESVTNSTTIITKDVAQAPIQPTTSQMTFSEGSIVVKLEKATEDEAKKTAMTIYKELKRLEELEKMKNYKPIRG